MPRRTQTQIVLDEAQTFLDPLGGGGPTRTDRSAAARATRRERREIQRITNYEAYRARLDRNNENRRSIRSLERYLRGETEEANLNLNSAAQIQRFLDRMLPGLEQGERFILNNGNRYFTLTNEKYVDIQTWLTSAQIFGDDYAFAGGFEKKSDEEAQDGEFYSNMTVSSVPGRVGGAYAFAQGAYFPYTHDFDCEDLIKELANLGCWKEVTKENYDDNCLYNAFSSAGVSEAILNAMKTEFLRRKISRKNLRAVAEQHDLYIEISTDQDKNMLKYGNPEKGFPVKLALYKDHFIHLYKTKFNNYAVLHYDEVKDKGKNWWTWKSDTKRDSDRGMTSINLLRTILETEHVKMIDIATEGIFKTQFYDQVSTMEFSSLEYPPKYSIPFHPPRDGKGAYTGEGKSEEEEDEDAEKTEEEIDEDIENEAEEKLKKRILKYREVITEKDPSVLDRLDKKFGDLKLGLEEQAKLLAKSIPVDANIFFDFESTTEESLDPDTIVNECAKKIRNMREGNRIIEKIEKKVVDGNLDIKATARLYQEQCPHVGYVCCYSEFGEGEVHEMRGPTCAKAFLDDLCEKYGREKGLDCEEKEFKPPIVRLLAHNITYDLSFLWSLLARVKTIEKGTSVVCGSAYYYRFGSERGDDPRATRKNCPNGDLTQWMENEGFAIYFSGPSGRCEHPQVWKRAIKSVRDHPEYLQSIIDFKKVYGIGKEISNVCQQAPFETFKETPPWCLDKVVELRFQDTYKMISMPLSDFGDAFKLDQAKEVMPYKLYTEEFVNGGGMATLEQLKRVPSFKEFGQLFKNLVDWGCQVGDRFDMLKYSAIYCKADVNVMKRGWKIFRQSFLDFADIDCFAYPTISSMGDAYMTEQGCYIDVHKIAGVPQRFIANASVGGRVMCANNERVEMTKESMQRTLERQTKIMGNAKTMQAKPLADFDGVSLYPSSMARIPGYLIGAPKVWYEGVDLKKADGYFLKIRVTSVGKNYRFPICRLKDDDGANRWTNDLEGKTITVDRFTLEDLVRFSKIKYEILQGYYFDEGRNDRVNEVITNLFNMRLKYKREGNPLQLVIKLVMNAAYGICGLKPIDTDIKYVQDGEKYANFVNNHFNRIKWFNRMNNNEWRFELYKEIDTHYNRQHVACEVLSVSKNIMNEVMCLAEDIGGACIHYTDTDSMHIDDDIVETLGREFKTKYGRELIGKKLCQFHTDFEFSGSYRTVDGKLEKVGDSMESVGEIKAAESYFIGKKTYLDRLVDGSGQECYHIRLKGIPAKCIQAKCDEDYHGSPMGLYKDLYEGKTVSFDLTSGGNCVFKSNKNHTMTTSAMNRDVVFPVEVSLLDYTP